MKKIKDHSLYLVITEEYGKGRSAIEIARAAIKGGVDIIQMREKNKPQQELIDTGKKLSRLCSDNNVIFIVNDDPMIAKETGADGVHLGQEDINSCPIDEARRIIGQDKIIGISAHSIETVKRANSENVDYIAFGPVFSTEIKEGCVGTQCVEKALTATKKPIVFIGGIDLCNIDGLLQMGAKNIALIRAILRADDITEKTRAFKDKLLKAKGRSNGKITRTWQDTSRIF